MASGGSVAVLPMFPLGTVLFPFATLPLHVFEPRYRRLVRTVLDGGGEFGVVLIERGSEVGGGDVRSGLGTVARLVEASELPDGRWMLLAVGTARLRVEEWLPDDPFPQARVTIVDEPSTEVAVATSAREQARAALVDLFELAARADPHAPAVPVQLSEDPVRAAFEAAALAPVGPFDAQRLLEAPEAASRLVLVATLVEELAAVLRLRLDDNP